MTIPREEIIRLAKQSGIAQHGLGFTCWEGQLERFAALVAAKEREACARVLDELVLEHPGRADLTAVQCAAAISARGESK